MFHVLILIKQLYYFLIVKVSWGNGTFVFALLEIAEIRIGERGEKEGVIEDN